MLSKEKLTSQIGEKVRKVRESKNMSQEELAHQAGLYRTYIGHIEVGRYTPSTYTLYRIAKALKVSSSDLLPF